MYIVLNCVTIANVILFHDCSHFIDVVNIKFASRYMELTLRQMALSYVGSPSTNAAVSGFACWKAHVCITFPCKNKADK
jgi:hypothetical protein